MRNRSGRIMISICISLLVSACSSGTMPSTSGVEEKIQFQGILLHESSILVTKSTEQQLTRGQLISLSFPEGVEAPPIGSLYNYEIDSGLRESWPPQGIAKKIEEVQVLAGHTVISFDTGEAILQHLPESAYLIDVRTPNEYEGGHVSGSQNIPVNRIKTAILVAVPEKNDIIIVYCRSGNRSAQAGKMLEDLGYQIILDAGGIIDYEGEKITVGQLPG